MKKFISIIAVCIIILVINIVVSTFIREGIGYDNWVVIWIINFVIDLIVWYFFLEIINDRD